MLASLKTESFVLSTLLKLHPKTPTGGMFYQRRERDTEIEKPLLISEDPCDFTSLCPLASVTASAAHILPVDQDVHAQEEIKQTRKRSRTSLAAQW